MHDIDTTLDPDDRDAALERGFLQHDTLTFRGKRLIPLCLATYTVLQRSGNRLLTGNSIDPLGDAVGFVLLHSADPDERRETRRKVYAGQVVWNEYVYQYMESNPDMTEELLASVSMFTRMVEDFTKTLTKSVSADGGDKKKSGVQAT